MEYLPTFPLECGHFFLKQPFSSLICSLTYICFLPHKKNRSATTVTCAMAVQRSGVRIAAPFWANQIGILQQNRQNSTSSNESTTYYVRVYIYICIRYTLLYYSHVLAN